MQRTTKESLQITEIHRDHLVQAAMLRFMAPHIQDHEVRSMLERHSQQIEQEASRLSRFSENEPGIEKWKQLTRSNNQFGPNSFAPASSYQEQNRSSWQSQNWSPSFSSSPSSDSLVPEVALAQCMCACKSLSLMCNIAASESADPQLRQHFMDLSNTHLRMAEELFRILHQRDAYPVPNQQPQPPHQAHAYSGSYSSPSYGQYQREEPTRSSVGYTNASNPSFRNY